MSRTCKGVCPLSLQVPCEARFPLTELAASGSGGANNVSNYKFGTNALGVLYNDFFYANTLAAVKNQSFGLNAGAALGADVNNNVAIGANAMQSSMTTGAYNLAIGAGALSSLSSGTKNVAVGAQAAAGTTVAGSNNVVIGADTQLGNGVSYSVAIGKGASVVTDNTIVLGGPTNVSLLCSGLTPAAATPTSAPANTWYVEPSSRSASVGIIKLKA